ncbi:MAG: antitoxin family protein [Desulfobacterales bacterium]
MMLTIEALYDGKVFLPLMPISLKPDTHVRIAVLPHEEKTESFLNTARSLQLNGPPDWSEKLDEYLYGGICALQKPDFSKKSGFSANFRS